MRLTPNENEYADKVTKMLFDIAVKYKTEYIWQLRELGGQAYLEKKLLDMFDEIVKLPLLPFLVRGLFELGPFRMERKNVLINLNRKYGVAEGVNFPRYVYYFIIELVHKAKNHHKHRPMYDDMKMLLKYVIADNLDDMDDISVTEGVYAKDEIKNLNNYLRLRTMKPETQRHFGDILSSL